MQISNELLNKYNVPVPRYTSYPPANHFIEFSSDNYMDMLIESNLLAPQLISIYIHIPFCNKMCFYCGCNACHIGDGHLVKPYIDALKKEISMVAAHLDKRRKVAQIHYGGGTPNAIPSKLIEELNSYLFETFEFIEKPEIAIETHPGYIDETYIENLKNARFNRFSMGIQDFNEQVLKTVNREPARMSVKEIMDLMKHNSSNIAVNLDFIYGLPHQTTESFLKTMDKALELQPDRLVTFSYAHVPWIKKAQKVLEKAGLPSANEKMDMFLAAYHFLSQGGYNPIGLDHFVKDNDELYIALQNKQLHRNFQGYATRRTTGQVYAFGASAISQTETGYAQNEKDTQRYINLINGGEFATENGMRVSHDQIKVREVITHVMCNKELNWNTIADSLEIEVDELKQQVMPDKNAIKTFEEDGLIELNDSGFKVTETGALFIRNIAAALDPEFKSQKNKYSKSV
jgi:oxygen-independent coproporphyrinogen-3 oxidase